MRGERMDADGVMRSSDGWGFGEYLRDQLASLGDRRKGIAWLRGVLWGFTVGGGDRGVHRLAGPAGGYSGAAAVDRADRGGRGRAGASGLDVAEGAARGGGGADRARRGSPGGDRRGSLRGARAGHGARTAERRTRDGRSRSSIRAPQPGAGRHGGPARRADCRRRAGGEHRADEPRGIGLSGGRGPGSGAADRRAGLAGGRPDGTDAPHGSVGRSSAVVSARFQGRAGRRESALRRDAGHPRDGHRRPGRAARPRRARAGRRRRGDADVRGARPHVARAVDRDRVADDVLGARGKVGAQRALPDRGDQHAADRERRRAPGAAGLHASPAVRRPDAARRHRRLERDGGADHRAEQPAALARRDGNDELLRTAADADGDAGRRNRRTRSRGRSRSSPPESSRSRCSTRRASARRPRSPPR